MNRRSFVALLPAPAIAQELQACGSEGSSSDVVHQANITVDEHGTEAAAATAVVMAAGAAPGQTAEPIELTVDRPFTFMISHAPTGSILFLGRVTDPTA